MLVTLKHSVKRFIDSDQMYGNLKLFSLDDNYQALIMTARI